MKTIFVALAAGQEIRNILYGDFYKLVLKNPDIRLVAFLPEDKVEKYKSEFTHERVVIEPIVGVDLDRKTKQLFRIVCYGCVPTKTISSRIKFSYLWGGTYLNYLSKYFFWILGHSRAWRALMRFIEYHFFHDDAVWRPYFEKYKPDVVFGAGLISEEDLTMVKYAIRHGIPNVGMTRSWDNFTSKAFLRVHSDILFVQNDHMVREAVRLNSVPKERIRVVGFPQWDHYYDPSWQMTKEEFGEQFGIDPAKKWIVYYGGGLAAGLFGLPETGEHVVMLQHAIGRGEIKDATVVVRPHPGPLHRDALHPEARKCPVLLFGKGWDFKENDMKLLMNLVRLSDVVTHMGSTIALEAAIFDRPTILIGFNGFQSDSELPWHHRLSTALNNTLHYQEIEATGGNWRVSNEKELIEAVNTYLKDPSVHRAERQNLVKTFVGPTDGKSGKRIFDHLLSLTNKTTV